MAFERKVRHENIPQAGVSTQPQQRSRRPRRSLGQTILYYIAGFFRALFNINLRLKIVLPLLIIAVVVSVLVTRNTAVDSIGGKSEYSEAQRYIEIKNVAEEYFIGTVDRNSMADSAASAMITGLGDKWSYFMSADDYKSYQLYSSSEYAEIGFTMVADDGGGYQVASVTQGSAADEAGLSAGMVIISVDGTDVTDSDIDTVRTLIRSKLNSTFVLGIKHGDDITVDCTAQYVTSVEYRLEKTEAGYVQIHDFEAGTGDDAIAAIEDLLFQGASSLVIDVRNNPGGLASEASKLLDYLLPEGDLFSLVDCNGKKTTYSSDSICIEMPICILINTGTYAEAEVFSAVLQEHSWGTTIGETTSGSTRIQETIELGDGSAVRLSTKTYVTANGNDICVSGGVVPDYIIYNTDESTAGTTDGTTGISDGTSTASSDEQLMAALKYLS